MATFPVLKNTFKKRMEASKATSSSFYHQQGNFVTRWPSSVLNRVISAIAT